MPARQLAIVIDAADPDALRDFWVAAMRYEPHGSAGAYRSATPPAGEVGPKLVFQRVDDPQTPTKNRLHIDIVVGDEIATETERLTGFGGVSCHRPDRRSRYPMDRARRPGGQRVLPGVRHVTDPVGRLRSATISNGAPSARNLLVTVFGDALLPHGTDTAVSVSSLAALLEPFGVSERLVRTSLTRLVNDGLLSTRAVGRRSFYGVATRSVPLFRQADARIYGSRRATWDRSWTIVVIDGTEATPSERARLRQRLTWAGLGGVAPNVMASPVVTAEEAALVVEQAGGFRNVLVSRSRLVEGASTIDEEELARRCAPLDEVAAGYDEFVDRFGDIDRSTLDALDTRRRVQASHPARRHLPAHRARRSVAPRVVAARRMGRCAGAGVGGVRVRGMRRCRRASPRGDGRTSGRFTRAGSDVVARPFPRRLTRRRKVA